MSGGVITGARCVGHVSAVVSALMASNGLILCRCVGVSAQDHNEGGR
jgi:hypothetical protein